MYTNNLQLIGNLVDAPDVQVTPSGVVRARFRIASTERRRDPATESWQDGESVFVDVTCWRRLAQHVGNSLVKGDRVIVLGRLRQWVAERDGTRRTVLEVDADAVGPDLQRGMATIARPRRPGFNEAESGEAGSSEAGSADAHGVDIETGEIGAGSSGAGSDELAASTLAGPPLEVPAEDAQPLDPVFDARPLADLPA